MTSVREEWKLCYRYLRAHQPKKSITFGQLNKALKSLYSHDYTPNEQAFVNLIRRYRKSKRLTKSHYQEYRKVQRNARERAKDWGMSLVYQENPFLALIPKEDKAGGFYATVQLQYE